MLHMPVRFYPSQVGDRGDWPALTYVCASNTSIAFTRLWSYTLAPGSRGGNVGRAKRYVTTAWVVVNAILVAVCWYAGLITGDILMVEEFVQALNNSDIRKRCKTLLISFLRAPMLTGRLNNLPNVSLWSIGENKSPFGNDRLLQAETCDVIF